MANFIRDNGQILLQEYGGFGGKSFDSNHLTNFYNYDKPHDFGVMVSKIFTSNDRFSPKPLTSLTNAVGNFKVIQGAIYKWQLVGDDERLFTVKSFLESGNARPGWGNQRFRIALDEGWLREPDVISPEDNRYVLEIKGNPVQVGSYWEYEVELQGSDPNAFIDPSQLQIGKTFIKVATSVGTEMNPLYGTGQWGSALELQSQIGAFAEEFNVTDRVVREEIRARRNGDNTKHFSGLVFRVRKDGKDVPGGGFMTFMEGDLLDRLEWSREYLMTFGKVGTKTDVTGKYIRRTAPGFRELVKDGHEYYHNGSLTAQQLEDFFMGIFLTRKDENDRDIVLDTGTLGSRMIDQLLSDEASAFLTVDTNYIRQMKGGENWELEYGAQFKHFVAKNGIKVRFVLNPMKDDPKFCRRMHPDNPIFTIDSARMDIYDFGSSASSGAPQASNISMIKEDLVDEYYWVAGCVDPKSGVVNTGATVSSAQKGVICRRATTGSLCVWDTSRIGSIIYEPELV